jgi:hypothetical protein
VKDFLAAWNKAMNLDRYDLACVSGETYYSPFLQLWGISPHRPCTPHPGPAIPEMRLLRRPMLAHVTDM